MNVILVKWTVLISLNLKLVISFENNLVKPKHKFERLALGLKNFGKLNTRWSKTPFKKYVFQPVVRKKAEPTLFLRIGGKIWPDWDKLFKIQSSAESTEDLFPGHIYHAAPVNFNEIFSRSLAMLSDDSLTSVTKNDDLHLDNNIQSKLSEFSLPPEVITTTKATTTTSTTIPTPTPSPKYPKPSYIVKDRIIFIKPTTKAEVSETTMTTSTPSTTTKLQTKKPKRAVKKQRGVLDLLFPPWRVQGFKNVFDSFRKILSRTF